MTRAKATIHWVPHGRMAADVMTHVDVARANGALCSILRSGQASIVNESSELSSRAADSSRKSRS
eukprot:9312639-Alexandrium_andersonii.AAC.1